MTGRPTTLHAADAATVSAPDGSLVRVLLRVDAGSMARFELEAGRMSLAVRHRTVEEIWYVLAGRGEMWRRAADDETVVALETGVCLTIPAGTSFQFRAGAATALVILAVTMPPWPGPDEAEIVPGCPTWEASPIDG
jgi:mannose-6-phosphate isomerase-like protein (cupin superfamily)